MANTVELKSRGHEDAMDPNDPLMELSRIIGMKLPGGEQAVAAKPDPQLSIEDSFALDLERELADSAPQMDPEFELDLEQGFADDLDVSLDLGNGTPSVVPSLEDELNALLIDIEPAKAAEPDLAFPAFEDEPDFAALAPDEPQARVPDIEPELAGPDFELGDDWLDASVQGNAEGADPELADPATAAEADDDVFAEMTRGQPSFDPAIPGMAEVFDDTSFAVAVEPEFDALDSHVDTPDVEFESGTGFQAVGDDLTGSAIAEIAELELDAPETGYSFDDAELAPAPEFDAMRESTRPAADLERLVARTAPQPVVESLAEVPEPIDAVDEFDIPDFEFEPEPESAVKPAFDLHEGDFHQSIRPAATASVAAAGMQVAENAFNETDFDFNSILDEELGASTDTFGAQAAPAAAAGAYARANAQPQAEPDLDIFRTEIPSAVDYTPSRSRLPLYAGAAVVALAVLAGGWWSLSGSSNKTDAGGSVLVKADTDPVKIAPENAGNAASADNDKAVYDKVTGANGVMPTDSQLVSESEEPLDIAAATPPEGEAGKSEARVDPNATEQAPSGQAADTLAIAPKRVKTLVVKPDGTLVERPAEPVQVADQAPVADANPGAAAIQPPAAVTNAQDPAQQPEPVQPVADSAVPAEPVVADAAPAAGQQAEAVDTAPAPVEETQPTAPVAKKQPAADGGVKVVKTKKIKPPVDEAQAAAVPADAGPVGERPADQPVTIVGQTGGQNAGGEQQVASAADAATQAGAGGYAIQIASTPSPEAAKSTYAALTRKYGGVISGRGVSIQKADVDGKGTVYRVRIPAGSKQEAAALCAKYKASGGSCFVTK